MPRMPYPHTTAVAAAEQEHQAAKATHQEALTGLATVRASIESGAMVEPSALTEAQARVDHSELRIEAMHRRVARTRSSARTAVLASVARQVREYDLPGAQTAFVEDVQRIQDAVNELVERIRRHDAAVESWRQPAAALRAEGHPAGWLPPPDQAGVAAVGNAGVSHVFQFENTLLGRVDPAAVLAEIAANLHLAGGRTRVDLAPVRHLVGQNLIRTMSESTPRADTRVTEAHFRD